MQTRTQPQPVITPEEYLEFDRAAEERLEYFDGQIIAMGGGRPVHSLVTANIGAALSNLRRGKPYRAFSPHLRVSVDRELITYPDVVVACPPFAYVDDHRDTITNPVLIVEVLSPSTADYDRGAKLPRYREIPSLREYLLVDPQVVSVEHGWRLPNNHWEVEHVQQREAILRLECLGENLPVDEIYDGVELFSSGAQD